VTPFPQLPVLEMVDVDVDVDVDLEVERVVDG
jgi:hypothetical protein